MSSSALGVIHYAQLSPGLCPGGGLSPDTAYNVSGVTRKQDRKHSQRHHAVFAATAERFFKQGGHRSLKTE